MAAAWDRGLAALAAPAPILQSWGYGEVQAHEGWRVERVELPSGGRATMLLQGAGRLRWAYTPRGPVPANRTAFAELVDWSRQRGLARLRVEPEAAPELAGCLLDLGFRPCPATHPSDTLLVPLGAEAEMLAAFKPKHRYNIRLAARRGVEVTEGGTAADAAELARQATATARRQGISLPSLGQYVERLACLAWCRVYVARHAGQALAAIMVARFGGRAYYLFGGSSGERRELMPAYAAQWAAMRAAAQSGCLDYDLWGLPPAPDPAHPWYGLWQFKTGFEGVHVRYCGAWELALAPLAAGISRAEGGLRRTARRLGAWLPGGG